MESKTRFASLALRVILGGFFVVSGLSKVMHPIEYFQIVIEMYHVVPEQLNYVVALVVPWTEILCGLFLMLGYWSQGASLVLTGLVLSFEVILAQALIRGLSIDECGCFGGGRIHPTLYQTFTMDTILVLILLQVAFFRRNHFSLDYFLLKDEAVWGGSSLD